VQRSKILPALAVASVSVFLAGHARAGGGAATDAYDDIGDLAIEVRGLADLYLQGNFNRPSSGVSPLRAFDGQIGQPSLGLFRLTLAHKPDPIGFRLDAGVGSLANAYLHFDPAATQYPDLSRALSYVEQAFVTATVPVGRGLSVDFGKFGTPVGLEDNESLQAWNYSRSLLYLLAEPTFHSGLRLTYPITETVAVSLFWVNGWDANVLDGNGMRAAAGAVTWKPLPKLELVVDYMGGLERQITRLSDPTLTFRNEVDAYVRYEPSERVAFALTGDYGRDAALGGASWGGVGAYARIGVYGPVAVAARGERYADPDGFTSGQKQELTEATATLEVRSVWDALTWVGRFEYRRDQSDEPFFARDLRGFSNHQDTLGVSLVAAF
jgi:Putative beta-barrel porin-2, OmpL-like. bbp2